LIGGLCWDEGERGIRWFAGGVGSSFPKWWRQIAAAAGAGRPRPTFKPYSPATASPIKSVSPTIAPVVVFVGLIVAHH